MGWVTQTTNRAGSGGQKPGLRCWLTVGCHECCENCGCAVLGEGKAREDLGWEPLGPCPRPHSHVEMEALQGTETLLRFRPVALLLCPSPLQ